NAREAAETADGGAVICVLVQIHTVLRDLESCYQSKFASRPELVFDIRLERGRNEVLVKIGQRRVHPSARIRRTLIPVGVRPLIPHASPENSTAHFVAERRDIAGLTIAVQLIYSAGGIDRLAARNKESVGAHRRIVVVLFVP